MYVVYVLLVGIVPNELLWVLARLCIYLTKWKIIIMLILLMKNISINWWLKVPQSYNKLVIIVDTYLGWLSLNPFIKEISYASSLDTLTQSHDIGAAYWILLLLSEENIRYQVMAQFL